MRRIVAYALVIILTALTASPFLNTAKTSAVTASDWRAGRIIDDAVFVNKNSMSVSEIQNFLNAKVPSCDSSGSQPSSYWYAAAGRYYTRAERGASLGYPAPYTCLRDFYEVPKTTPAPGVPANNYGGKPIPAGAISAAQMIFDAAQAYSISPKVLLVTIHKESAGPLTTDDWPFSYQYTYAMGAYCPDGPNGAQCDPNYAGFSIQIRESARLFRYYLDNMNQPWWPHKKIGNNTILWNVVTTNCGGANVNIETNATAALYTYTPYQPNQAALNNMYGTGDGCSAYGNRNFWRIFNDWFGSTIGPNYAWQIDDLTYSGGDNFIGQGQTETITLKAKNIGRVPWYNHGSCPVRLGTWEPGRSSKLASPSWISPSRMTTLQENVVQPNEVGTFRFQVTPAQLGSSIEGMNLVVENCEWMQWPGLSPTITVTDQYNWQVYDISYGSGTGLMEPGSTQLVTVKAKNTGTATWSKVTGPAIKLATWEPGRNSRVSNSWMSPSRVTLMNESSVAPGQVAGFQFTVNMPESGMFYERMNLVAEGQNWFNDAGLTLYLQGQSYAWQPIWASPSTGTWNIPRNTPFTLTIKAKNTGTATWTKNGIFPVRLGTDAPTSRGSGLEAPSWMNPIRPTGLVENSVPPGGEGTFTFTAKTPSTPGLRYEAFNLVAEGILWFQSPNFGVNINVQ